MFIRIRKALNKKLAGLASAGAAVAVAAVLIPASSVAYGPARPTFDYNKAPLNGSTCTDQDATAYDRCGSLNGPVFDSFVNTPSYGNELNFEQVAPVNGNNAQTASYGDSLTATPGQEYWVRVYVHNNANQGDNCEASHLDANGDCTQLDAGSKGIATNTHVRLGFDKGQANGFDIQSYISADNANPGTVWDDAYLKNDNNQFSVQYVPGSAFAVTAQQSTPQPLSDDIAGPNGVKIGESINGNIDGSGNFPACFNFVTHIYLKVKVVAPTLVIHKVAYVSGTSQRVDGTTMSTRGKITWKIYVANEGSDEADNLTIRDVLPKGDTFIPGTLKLYTTNENGTVQTSSGENAFFNAGGINFGQYNPLTAAQDASYSNPDPAKWYYSVLLTYQTNVTDDQSVCSLTNQAFTRATGVSEVGANSTVNLTCAKPPVTPPTTTPPTTLPSTGAGSVAGIFAGVSAAGAAGYRWFLGRRLSRQ